MSVPKLALVNGYFRGDCPLELSRLNRTEASMVSAINVISRISMLPNGGHWQSQSQATVFSVLNNVVEVSERLPVILPLICLQ